MIDPYQTLQVSEVITVINEALQATYPAFIVEGEIASFKVNQNKYVFFDIKDAGGSLGCFMMAFQLKFPLEDGMKVKILAEPKLTNWGKFSLTVREVMPVGEGSLKKSLERLKATLEEEGLFDPARKRLLPKIPQRIGVVSSSQAAGYIDFMKILENRWAGLSVVLADVPVQGLEAPAEIIGALHYLNELSEPFDLIAVIRGGGSADDLAAFSHEGVVRAIAGSRTPVVVGVGHEVDVSLADLAADLRAATPSNAAELLVPDKAEVMKMIAATTRISKNGAETAIRVFSEDTKQVKLRIQKRMNDLIDAKAEKLKTLQAAVRLIDPEAVLRRGYSLVRKGLHIVRSKEDVTIGDELQIQCKDGNIEAVVKNV